MSWLAASALVPLLLFVAASWYDKDATIARARDNMEATTHALAAHAQAVMQSASLALTLQIDRVQGLDWTQIGGSQQVHDFLSWLVQQMPQLEFGILCRPRRVQLRQQPRLSDASLR